MIREDRLSIIEQAQQAGHSAEVHLRTYAHVFAELKGRGGAAESIRKARAKLAAGTGKAEAHG